MTRLRWLITFSTMCASSAATAHGQAPAPQDGAAPLGGAAVAGQVSTGILGTAVGFVGGGLATRWVARKLGSNEDRASRAAYFGAYSGAALATAAGPAIIGSRGDAHGSYPAAVGGAVAGGLVSVLIKRMGSRGTFGERGPLAIIAGLAIVALPSVGATLACNSTR